MLVLGCSEDLCYYDDQCGDIGGSAARYDEASVGPNLEYGKDRGWSRAVLEQAWRIGGDFGKVRLGRIQRALSLCK